MGDGRPARSYDGNGSYTLSVPAQGTYVLAARADGHAPLASSATHTGDDSTLDLDLSLPDETVTA